MSDTSTNYPRDGAAGGLGDLGQNREQIYTKTGGSHLPDLALGDPRSPASRAACASRSTGDHRQGQVRSLSIIFPCNQIGTAHLSLAETYPFSFQRSCKWITHNQQFTFCMFLCCVRLLITALYLIMQFIDEKHRC